MDVQFWIYIIIGVIYFLSRMLKKPEQEAGAPPETARPERRPTIHAEQPATERPRQLTFEELLREITEAKQVQRREPDPEPEPEFQSYETEFREEARSLEQIPYDDAENARVFKVYQDAKNQVFERQSLEETLRLKDTVVDFRKFEAFDNQKERKLLDDYIRLIRNPQSLRQAVVMSEILKRKFWDLETWFFKLNITCIG